MENSKTETGRTPEQFSWQEEYKRCVLTLSRIGILSILPESESLGIIGFDGKEYPMPSLAEMEKLFKKNKELVNEKVQHGFTRLQLTPLNIPLAILKSRAQTAILKHAKEGKIFQAKKNPQDPDVPIHVNTEEPLFIWENYLSEEQSGKLAYFPRSYDQNHHGFPKETVGSQEDICAVPGWSIGLVEDSPFLPQEGQGKTIRERKQLENNRAPIDYLKILSKSQYQGETGWTPEDFLINFLTRLEETNQVSHDWNDHSGAWLLGTYLTQSGGVPDGYWNRGIRQLSWYRSAPGNRAEGWGAPSTVRLKF